MIAVDATFEDVRIIGKYNHEKQIMECTIHDAASGGELPLTLTCEEFATSLYLGISSDENTDEEKALTSGDIYKNLNRKIEEAGRAKFGAEWEEKRNCYRPHP